MTKINLKRVHFIPGEISEGILYYSEEYDIAVHICPCGCGNRIYTPIGPTDWEISINQTNVTLFPSISNWQQCKSHYWIVDGRFDLSEPVSYRQAKNRWKSQEKWSKKYYASLYPKSWTETLASLFRKYLDLNRMKF